MGTPNEGINGTLATGLVAHWDFDAGTFTDKSGNGRDLTKMGNPTSVADKDGNAGNAYDGMDIDNQFYFDDSVENVLLHSDITVSIWTNNKNDSAGYHDLFITNELQVNGFQYGVFIARESSSLLYGTNAWFTTVTAPDGWYNVTVTYDWQTAIWKCYVNGVYQSEQNIAIQFVPTIWQIGGGQNTSGETALVDEVRVYDRLLTVSEIAELFEMGVNYTPAPVVFNTIHPYRGAKNWNTSLNTCLTTIATELGLTLTLPSTNEVNWNVKILTALTAVESHLGTQLDKPKRDDKNWDVKLNRCLSKIINVINGEE